MNGAAVAMTDQGIAAVVELNVGGVFYTTSLATLTSCGGSLLGQMFSGCASEPLLRDSKGRFFIDRDGVLFRYVLDFLRSQKAVLPDNFQEGERLLHEAEYFQLPELEEALRTPGSGRSRALADRSPGCIMVGYRGTFAFGRDGLADVKFRKLARILVSGRVALCREAFGETLNESRDPDRGHVDRYTSRFFLKHSFLEQAFDMLYDAGFRLTSSCGSGTASISGISEKPGSDSEENRWNHYNEFVFVRD
ncbi:BTB/POZ domain-containing protein KCTD16-like [Pollicipes pollicipes]|uniref:BTB/POZ domain-containing protein KCTD16-like n=1 Tax=Pollicipes pollicipes TaxID=41117 RepID=UPI0018855F15|nr:BTB/POZ domain-containing protein KCTD16-like [Pollicipes pollicipes]